MRCTLRRGAAVLAVAWLLAAPAARADAPAKPSPWGYAVANELMSPYCPGRTLADCPSDQAAELRRWILAQEEKGRSRADVEAELYQRYGDGILQAPRPEGFGLAAYVIPTVAFLAGGTVVGLFLRRQRAGGAAALAAPRAAAPLDPELDRLLDEEMRRTESRD